MSGLAEKALANYLNAQNSSRSKANEEPITSVAQFVKTIIELKDKGMPTAFRGQKNFSWKGKAPIHRPGQRLVKCEHEMVRELISIHPQEFQQDATMFDRLVRMQHYGLPTRLLDVTLNPLVALFFAAQDYYDDKTKDGVIVRTPRDGKVSLYRIPNARKKYYDSDTVACLANLANLNDDDKERLEAVDVEADIEAFNELSAIRELVRYINQEKPNFSANIGPITLYRPVFVRPKNNNRRIIAQAGAFIIYGLENKGLIYETTIKQTSLRIQADKKSDIRDELAILGIDASTLFPELDKAAEIISKRHLKDLESIII